MDLHTHNRRASQRGQRRLDDAMPDDAMPEDERNEREPDSEPDFEQLSQDRAEARAMRRGL